MTYCAACGRRDGVCGIIDEPVLECVRRQDQRRDQMRAAWVEADGVIRWEGHGVRASVEPEGGAWRWRVVVPYQRTEARGIEHDRERAQGRAEEVLGQLAYIGREFEDM